MDHFPHSVRRSDLAALVYLLVEVDLWQAELFAAFSLLHEVGQPLLPALDLLLGEGQGDAVVVLVAVVPVTMVNTVIGMFCEWGTSVLNSVYEFMNCIIRIKLHDVKKLCRAYPDRKGK